MSTITPIPSKNLELLNWAATNIRSSELIEIINETIQFAAPPNLMGLLWSVNRGELCEPAWKAVAEFLAWGAALLKAPYPDGETMLVDADILALVVDALSKYRSSVGAHELRLGNSMSSLATKPRSPEKRPGSSNSDTFDFR